MPTLLRIVLFLVGLAILVALFVALDAGEILRLIAGTGWTLLLIAVAYAGCQVSRAAALWRCQLGSLRQAVKTLQIQALGRPQRRLTM